MEASRSLREASLAERHEKWKARYGRIYKYDVEKATRFEILKKNVEFIESFNNGGTRSYKLGVNEFADMTNEEFRASRNGYKMCFQQKSPSTMGIKHENVTEVPTSMDWRKKGAVTRVKDQGKCAVEGINQLKTSKLISLSEQELLDCDVSGEDQGCNGGFMDSAFKFILLNHGLTTESNYPYDGTDGTCNSEKEAPRAAMCWKIV
ncbi:Senescence-specific cysteine protease SAG12 [Abeliophyllum distichum]|uniref:Senescence-specific cysteine protease SAG12 n=1 Tax=Abeliophyllum distichum TaxID=126358 RepID=A0ABD1PTP8_9LAMI